jgi:hypothetical protein
MTQGMWNQATGSVPWQQDTAPWNKPSNSKPSNSKPSTGSSSTSVDLSEIFKPEIHVGVTHPDLLDDPTRDYRKADPDIAKWTSIAHKPIKFNPPLHSMSRPVRVDFATENRQGVQTSLDRWTIDSDSAFDIDKFEQARLGRIVQAENALGGGARGDSRWGFRFQYNPVSLTTTTTSNNTVLLDTSSEVGLHLSGTTGGNYQYHTFKLLLNRIRDLEGPLTPQDYEPDRKVDLGDIEGIQRLGTMWDMEYLFRVCNGVWPLEDMGESGNIGLLQPNPAFFFLGPGIRHYGFVYSVSYEHKRFTPMMVPILTEVTITFRRIVYVTTEKAQDWVAWAGYHAGGADEWDEVYGGGSSSSSSSKKDETSADTDSSGGSVEGVIPAGAGFSLPLEGIHIPTTEWTYKSGGGHYAYDYGTARRGTKCLAVRDGVILDLNDGVPNNPPGVNPGSGSPSNWLTLGIMYKGREATVYYQHLSPGLKVRKGQQVKAGQHIADSGNTGNSTGDHLHLATMYGRRTKTDRYIYMNNNGRNEHIIWPPSEVWT